MVRYAEILLVLQILFLLIFLQYTLRQQDWRTRLLLPVLAMVAAGILSAMLDQIEPDLGVTFIVLIPTMAVLTVYPLIGSLQDIKNRNALVILSCVILTLVFIFYRAGCNFGGVSSVFLPLWYGAPPGITALLQVQVVCIYGEMCILCGVYAGVIELMSSFFDDHDNYSNHDSSGMLILSASLLIEALLFNTLATGFLGLFLYRILQKIPFRILRFFLPLTWIIVYMVSILPVSRYSWRPVEPYDFFLFVLVLLATGIVMVFLAFEPYLPSQKKNHPLCHLNDHRHHSCHPVPLPGTGFFSCGYCRCVHPCRQRPFFTGGCTRSGNGATDTPHF
jgi:hypothetical protein